jgi:hypothetical protein
MPKVETELPEEPWAQSVLDQMYRLWIEPAIEARCLALSRDQVVKAAVAMPPDRPVEVLLNSEASLIAHVVAQRPIQEGEGLTAADLVDIRDLQLDGIDPNAGWIAFVNIGGVITLAFDFRRNRQTAWELITTGYLGPAVENGFAAAELALKAQMYLILDSPMRAHHQRLRWWRSGSS